MGGTEVSVRGRSSAPGLDDPKIVKEEIANSKIIMPERTPIVTA